MARVKVKTLATLYEATGSFEHVIEVEDGARIRDVVMKLVEMFPKVKEVLGDDVFKELMILHNGRHVEFLPMGIDTPVKDGDTIVLIPPAGGG